MKHLTKRTVGAAGPADKEYFVWCGLTPGFGVRIYPSGRKIFVAQVRVGRQTRRLRIGPYGAFTVEQARTSAREIIRSASLGIDPQRQKRDARQAITVAELCEIYMEAAKAGLVLTRFRVSKRQTTVVIDEGRITRHINPLIGSILARDLLKGTTSYCSIPATKKSYLLVRKAVTSQCGKARFRYPASRYVQGLIWYGGKTFGTPKG
ncbi:MAG: DUF4102 domain-containing protein [Alphaproteobacteria bacterium]|nr:DUF4102 domain-containing protein [Alphaproteobacteria bacterium]